jgi:hypothetical protein
MIVLKRFAQTLLFGLLAAVVASGAQAEIKESATSPGDSRATPSSKKEELNAAINKSLEPSVRTADFNTILAAKSEQLAIWQYSGNPDIYIFDFPNLTQQGKTFNRITQLTEQFNEPYRRVLTNQEIEKYLASIRRTQANMAFGNDVIVSDLVLFFNLAENDKVELNPEELMLRDFAISQGLIKVWRKFYQAVQPNIVILSIPQTQEKRANEPRISELARRTVLTHELAHGEYFSNSYYAKYCAHFWYNVLTDAQRDVFKVFLSKYNYGLNREELLVNEMQAYLLFTPDPSSFSAEKLGITEEELESMRKTFRKGMPATGLPIN